MVPHRLCIRNFLCYRENCPPLEFGGIEMACLVGENGHGKSALLDAITWAVWGQARSRSDDELIHLGRVDMEVEFEFRQGDVHYRVIRKRRRGSANSPGRTLLEFQVQAGDDWRPLTGSTVRDTQARIIDAVRLDYDTFCNSAFLMQGRADEFTLKAPGERKKVLSDILGLQIYEEYEVKAKASRNDWQDKSRLGEGLIHQLRGQLEKEPQYQRERDASQAELNDLAIDLGERRQRYEELRQTQQAVQQLRLQATEVERDRAKHAERAARADAELQAQRSALQRQQAIVARGDEIRARYAALGDARRDESEQAKRQGLVMHLRKEETAAQLAIGREEAQLAHEVAAKEQEAARLRTAAAMAEAIEGQREQHARARIELEGRTKHLASLRLELQENHNTAGQLQADNKRLRSDMEELKRKRDELTAGGGICPICRAQLGVDGTARLEAQYNADGSELAATFKRNKLTQDAAEGRTNALVVEIKRLEELVKAQQTGLDRSAAALEREARDAADAAAKLPTLDDALTVLRRRLERRDFALDARKSLALLDARVVTIGFDAQILETARSAVRHLAAAEGEYGELQRAEEAERAARAAAERAEHEVEEWGLALQEAEARFRSLTEQLQAMPNPGEDVARVGVEVAALEERERGLRQALGAAEQNLDNCRAYRRQFVAADAELTKAKTKAQIYDDLAHAFGRRGVQALIIDSVLPEIEEEANRLLSRMSNGRMTVALSTQRATQRNTTVETLDISIGDELGTRAYEMFSGGEAFRINLALRIALSKLLARRAGAPLPTLIVDEGFGTQDSAGRERLMEAIQAVSRDFECLIVITHIDELKDQFDRQIRVEKTADGSIATII